MVNARALLCLFAIFSTHAWAFPEKQYGRFAEGPLQVSVADLFTGSAIGLTSRFSVALDQPAVGSEVLHRGEALNRMDLVEDDQREDLTDTGNGTQ